ncbi:MAG TPA: ribonuclease H family protein [Anaerolineales bacterium]|nr:ribonuclease H family protein [Anaerolineales bacterium]
MSKQKYYVVWKGRKPGIFTSWAETEKQVKGFAAAQYKSFETLKEAEAAYRSEYVAYKGKPASQGKWKEASVKPILPSLCVDAACSGSPGTLEYRGVYTSSQEEIFRVGPFPDGTNNVGEFLAIVHALTWLSKHEKHLPIYSDSRNAISWVYTGECKTQLRHTPLNAPLFAIIHSAENWLAENELRDNAVLKWETELWGENPADFGRK